MLPDADEIVIMPGSVLTALSGGKIPPLYHQVRNHGLDDRQSIMYFVNPEVEAPLYSWIDAPDGTRTDIREHVQTRPTSSACRRSRRSKRSSPSCPVSRGIPRDARTIVRRRGDLVQGGQVCHRSATRSRRATFAATCSGVVAPAITLATAGSRPGRRSRCRAASCRARRRTRRAARGSKVRRSAPTRVPTRDAAALGRRLAAPVLAGQQAAGQREERQQPDAVVLQRRTSSASMSRSSQAVLVLGGDEVRGRGCARSTRPRRPATR